MDARPAILGRRAVLVGVQAMVVGGLLISTAGPALAARMDVLGSEPQASTSTSTGNYISYPQCGRTFPSAPAFGIAGLNGGLANNLNPCFGPSSSYPSYRHHVLHWGHSGVSDVANLVHR